MIFRPRKFYPPILSGNWGADGPNLVRIITDFLREKEPDDYIEKTWIPSVTFATPGNLSLAAYTVREGSYTRIGRVVIASLNVTVVPTHTTASGSLQVTGLPFTASSDTNYQGSGDVSWGGITKATYTQVSARVTAATSIVDFVASGSGVARSSVVAADVPSAGTLVLRATVIYRV